MEFWSQSDVPRARITGARAALAPALLFAVSSLSAAAPASAQNRPGGPRDNQCAVYGAGFVAVQGTGTCVRIGGRVRLELSGGSASGNALTSGGFGPDEGMRRAHMRIEGPLGRR